MPSVLIVSAEDLRPELARTALGQADVEVETDTIAAFVEAGVQAGTSER